MERQDRGLAFIQRYENIAWYEDGEVRILDRRVYPSKTEFFICKSHTDVMQAIRDMVTQSAGPYVAAPMGMALAAWECRNQKVSGQMQYLERAALCIQNARPTTKERLKLSVLATLPVAEKALKEGRRADLAIRDSVVDSCNERYQRIGKMGDILSDLFPDNGTVMTQCYADTILGTMLRSCREKGKKIHLFCPETRPYLQGARLTATVCAEMGFETTVITDNMPSYVMANEGVDIFTCAADAITCDGYVFNKVGTSQIAICAKHYGIPVYVSGAPDKAHPTWDTVKIEMRNPEETLEAMGVRTAAEGLGIKGYYPAFDMTSPDLITGIVTEKGVLKPGELSRYFDNDFKDSSLVIC
ncbi:MAG: s-methyl-5-thioribose-1-phosphate isomerase [Sphaerochaetaceae bacterium]|nr:s-methyl-5-thioribose-1-phosphate isomerase [Sphaerochaetaceae bacterium]